MKIYYSKYRIFKMLLLPLIVLYIGYSCIQIDSFFGMLLGVLNLILGSFTLFSTLIIIVKRRPRLVIDQDGIIDHRILKSKIQWHEIYNLELKISTPQKYLKLNISDNFQNFKWLFRKTSRKFLNKNPREVFINLTYLNIDYQRLNEMLKSENCRY
ncbi:MAG: STM3941 family protein [Psychroflexus sp.]